ncbi:MAG: FlgD immunoglobulin-like domain containing protein [Candidatus Latescibacterota bacterium]
MRIAVPVALTLAALASSEASAAARLVARPLAPQEITDFRLPAATQRATGLLTIGVGTPAYLEVQVDAAATLSGSVAWSLLSAPSGATATLATSPLDTVLSGAGAPIYTPGEAAVYQVASRRLLVPNAAGQWRVRTQLAQRTAAGADSTVIVEEVVTAATYVGAASCAGCHAKQPPFTGAEPGPGDTTQWAGTPHATLFTEAIDGLRGSYRSTCIRCHTVGYDTTASADNGAFDDVARQVGWTFPTTLQEGNWEAVPEQLQAKANIQCESCHGPGSQHNGNVADNRISSSMGTGTCAYCHESGSHHHRPQEWKVSGHGNAVEESSAGCMVCHNGAGFVERIDEGLDITQSDYATRVQTTGYEAISCQTCHDPHVDDEDHPFQLRTVADVELINGETVSEGGNGKLCMNCHKARRGGEEWASVYHSRHNPHGSPQTDMLVGTGAVEYGRSIRRSSHLYAVEGSCVGCHMQTVEATLGTTPNTTPNPVFGHAGGHTFLSADEEEDLVEACVDCHGPMRSFDIPKSDYDGDGSVEGVQTEIQGLLTMLGNALPPNGPAVTVTQAYTAKQLRAAFNYAFVQNDGSQGIHNTQYAVGILQGSIRDLTGRLVTSSSTVRVLQGRPANGRRLVASAAPAGGMRVAAGKVALPGRPEIYGLYQNGPNPFNPETEIAYLVPEPVSVRIAVYNALGQQVRTLVAAHHPPGEYSVTWDGKDADGHGVTAGVYVYTMEAGSFAGSGKMVLLP